MVQCCDEVRVLQTLSLIGRKQLDIRFKIYGICGGRRELGLSWSVCLTTYNYTTFNTMQNQLAYNLMLGQALEIVQ